MTTTTRRRTWAPDRTWTGDWTLPAVLRRPVSPDERRALVALALTGLGPAGIVRALAEADRITDATVARGRVPDVAAVERRLATVQARTVLPADDGYPAPLLQIPAPPPLLFVRGRDLVALEPMVAIVGARACSRGAARFARRLGETLAASGFTVVSGLARGIDRAAHEGALATGRTVAVLGTGIDVVYPAEHRELAGRIVERGALVTEFPPGTTPRAWHFPARNRIVSGLALATVVVEAGTGSGALITAEFALTQGRDVHVCLTGPENPAGAGNRAMLREGAALVVEPEDLAAELIMLATRHGYDLATTSRAGSDGVPAHLDGDLRAVYEAIGEDTTADEIRVRTGLGTAAVAGALAALELDDLATDDGTGRWSRTT